MNTAEEVDEQAWEEETEEEEVYDASPGGEQEETFPSAPPEQVPDAWARQHLGSPSAPPSASYDEANAGWAGWRPNMQPGNYEQAARPMKHTQGAAQAPEVRRITSLPSSAGPEVSRRCHVIDQAEQDFASVAHY